MSSALLTIDAFCKALDTTRQNYYNLAKAGKVAYVRLGKRVYIPASELERIAACAAPHGADAPRVAPAPAVEQEAK